MYVCVCVRSFMADINGMTMYSKKTQRLHNKNIMPSKVNLSLLLRATQETPIIM